MTKVAMAISAHPDDIEFSCCATISKLIDKDYKGIYVIVSNGENGFKIKNKSRLKRIKTREREAIEAAKIIGVKDVIFLHEKDGFLEYSDKLRKKLVDIIRKYKPNIIFTFDPANKDFNHINLHHRDHRQVAETVFDAVFAAKNKYIYPGKPWKVDEFYFFGSNKINYHEDITNKIDLKIKALSTHKSQFTDFSKVEKFAKERLSKLTKKYKYSEAFRVFKVDPLPGN